MHFLCKVKVMAHPLAGVNVDRGVEVECEKGLITDRLIGVEYLDLFGFWLIYGPGPSLKGGQKLLMKNRLKGTDKMVLMIASPSDRSRSPPDSSLKNLQK